MKKVVLYARSATTKLEVDRQFQSIQESLDPETHVVAFYSDVGSGMDAKRPGLQRALRQVRAGGANALMVTSLNRLTRSLAELKRLKSMFRIKISKKPENLG